MSLMLCPASYSAAISLTCDTRSAALTRLTFRLAALIVSSPLPRELRDRSPLSGEPDGESVHRSSSYWPLVGSGCAPRERIQDGCPGSSREAPPDGRPGRVRRRPGVDRCPRSRASTHGDARRWAGGWSPPAFAIPAAQVPSRLAVVLPAHFGTLLPVYEAEPSKLRLPAAA